MAIHWQPTANIDALKQRAQIINKIRRFFAERNILEVETPLLCSATVTDPHIQSFQTTYHISELKQQTFYLQTSPEYCMKRLLAAGSGPIYQICKAFRNNGESGRNHNPEFSMLEWYRPGFDHHQLMDDMSELLPLILQTPIEQRISYADLFLEYAGINPHLASIEELIAQAEKFALTDIPGLEKDNRNTWLDLFMSHVIEPRMPNDKPVFVYDYPTSQAALAVIRNDNPPVAERFEVYFKGIELANGFHELCDAGEQRKRFENDLAYRKQLNYFEPPIDENFLAALEHGLPDCAGVALGVDRLVMLALGKKSVEEVISFTVGRS